MRGDDLVQIVVDDAELSKLLDSSRHVHVAVEVNRKWRFVDHRLHAGDPEVVVAVVEASIYQSFFTETIYLSTHQRTWIPEIEWEWEVSREPQRWSKTWASFATAWDRMNSPTVRRLIVIQSAFRSAKQEPSASKVTKGRLNVSLCVYWCKSITCLPVNRSPILLVSLSHGIITSPVYLRKDAMVLPVSLLNYLTISPSYWLFVKHVEKIELPDCVMAEMCQPVKTVLYRLHCGRYICVSYSVCPF